MNDRRLISENFLDIVYLYNWRMQNYVNIKGWSIAINRYFLTADGRLTVKNRGERYLFMVISIPVADLKVWLLDLCQYLHPCCK